jgi:ABC-type polar amino acid transport system ATPase subunit
MLQTAIEARGLVMRYGDREVLHGIDLVVPQGMVVGFLGPNGAGKTTTVEILEGYRRRAAGSARVLGMDPASGGRELRERIGIVLQETAHNPDFTVRETVRRAPTFLIAEQVWDHRPPADGDPRFVPGESTFSAAPLAWSHGQFIRLAVSIDAGRPVETPTIVACRYRTTLCP